MVLHLLPAPESSPPCSEFTKSLGVRPAGTGLALDRIVLVSIPEPWQKPALAHPWLKPGAASLASSDVRSRMFAAVPWGAEPSIELYERTGLDYRGFRWAVGSSDEAAEVVSAIANADIGCHGMAPIEVTVPTFLICTQGSHDQCCGTFGEQLAQSIERERPAYRLRRISHTGGHRFAPTFLALPNGRMWAYADLALSDRVASGSETVDDFRMYCRGWMGASSGAAQVAELAARMTSGNPFLSAPFISVVDDDEDRRCEVRVDGMTARVLVRPGRKIPTIACQAPGGLPVKIANEYDWTVLDTSWS